MQRSASGSRLGGVDTLLSRLLITLLLFGCAHVPVLGADDLLLIISREHEVFEEIRKGVEESYDGPVKTVRLKGGTVNAQRLVSRPLAGVIAVGEKACRLAYEQLSQSPRVVCCTYGGPKPATCPPTWLHVDAVKHLDAHLPVIRLVTPEHSKIAILHKGKDVRLADFDTMFGSSSPFENLKVRWFHIRSWKELSATTKQALDWADILWIPADPNLMTTTTLQFVLKQSLLARKPVFTFSSRLVRGGALASLVPTPKSIGRRAVEWLDRGGSGYGPAIEEELWINLKVARYLGITIPEELGQYEVRKLK